MGTVLHFPNATSVASVLAVTALVTACNSPSSEDSSESLTHDPARLKVVLKQCKDAPDSMPERTCRAAAEAFRRRFFASNRSTSGNGVVGQDTSGTPRP
jgi:conjugative transfer region protein TrbK